MATAVREASNGSNSLSGAKDMKLLIVEDSQPVGQRLLATCAAEPAIRAVLAGSLSSAAAELPNMPDIIILDIQLPDGSGIDLLKTVKAENPATRVLMFSNHTAASRICLAAGADGFFDKANDFDALIRTVRTLVREASPAA
jgi:DNA-binding response OmpR family regulator